MSGGTPTAHPPTAVTGQHPYKEADEQPDKETDTN